MKRFGNFVLGAFLGGLIGSSVALLFAPVRGDSARQAIVDYFTNIKNEIDRASEEKRTELLAELEALRSGE